MAYSRSYPFAQISYSWNSKRKKQELFYSITVVILVLFRLKVCVKMELQFINSMIATF